MPIKKKRNIDPKSEHCPICDSKYIIDDNGVPCCPICGKLDHSNIMLFNVETKAFKILNKIISSNNEGRNSIIQSIAAISISKVLNTTFESISVNKQLNIKMNDFMINNYPFEVASTFNYDQVIVESMDPRTSCIDGFYIKNLDAKIESLNNIDFTQRPDLIHGVDIVLVRLVDAPFSNGYSSIIGPELVDEINKRINSSVKINNVYIVSNDYENNNEYHNISTFFPEQDTSLININKMQIWKFDGVSNSTKPILSFDIDSEWKNIINLTWNMYKVKID